MFSLRKIHMGLVHTFWFQLKPKRNQLTKLLSTSLPIPTTNSICPPLLVNTYRNHNVGCLQFFTNQISSFGDGTLWQEEA